MMMAVTRARARVFSSVSPLDDVLMEELMVAVDDGAVLRVLPVVIDLGTDSVLPVHAVVVDGASKVFVRGSRTSFRGCV